MKLRFIVLFSLLFGCMLFTSCSYAWSFDEFLYFSNTIKGENSNQTKAINTLIQYQDNVRAKIGNVNFTSFVCTNPNPNGGYCEFHFYLNPLQINSNNGQNIGFTYTDSNSANRDNLFSINYSTGVVTKTQWQSTTSWSVSSAFGLVETSNNFTNWGNSYFNNKWVEPYNGPVFTPVNNGSITVYNNNGVNDSFLRLPFYPAGDKYVTLGYITDFDEIYGINGYFGPFAFSSGDSNIVDSYLNSFIYSDYYGTNNNNLCFDSSTGQVFVNKNALYNMQGYNLYLNYQSNFADNNTTTFYDGNFYSYYGNTFPSSGDIISPDYSSTSDIGFINAFGDLTSYDDITKENVNANLNELFGVGTLWSGDIFSGDILGNLGYHDYFDNDYTLFIYSIYRNVVDIFTSTALYDESITINVHDWSMSVFPSDFYVPNTPLKTFVTTFLIAGIIILLVQQFHHLILLITTMDIVGTVRSFDRQHTFFM